MVQNLTISAADRATTQKQSCLHSAELVVLGAPPQASSRAAHASSSATELRCSSALPAL